MFYPCMAIVSMLLTIVLMLSLAIIDLERYSFSLFVVLLCMMGMILACAVCVANPKVCANPHWLYCACPDALAQLVVVVGCRVNRLVGWLMQVGSDRQQRRNTNEFTGANIRMMMLGAAAAGESGDPQRLGLFAPAVSVMSGVWRGMAWGDDDDDDDDDTRSSDTDDYQLQHISVNRKATSASLLPQQQLQLDDQHNHQNQSLFSRLFSSPQPPPASSTSLIISSASAQPITDLPRTSIANQHREQPAANQTEPTNSKPCIVTMADGEGGTMMTCGDVTMMNNDVMAMAPGHTVLMEQMI